MADLTPDKLILKDEDLLTADIVALARQHGRYGSRKSTALLREAG